MSVFVKETPRLSWEEVIGAVDVWPAWIAARALSSKEEEIAVASEVDGQTVDVIPGKVVLAGIFTIDGEATCVCRADDEG